MMDHRFETGTVVGKKSDTHWAQVIKTPYAFGVIEVEDSEGHAQSVGMGLIHEITKSISEPISSIQQVQSAIDLFLKPNIQTFILCVPMGGVITIILRGTGVVYLKRDGHIARLRSSEGTISGKIYPTDILFLSSKTCLNGVSEEEFFSFFDHMSVEESAEKLTLHLHKKTDAAGYAGLFVETQGDGKNNQMVGGVEPRQTEPEKKRFPRPPRFDRVKRKIRLAIQTLRNVDIRITAVLLILFVISVSIGIVRERSGKTTTEATKTIGEIQRLYDEGVALLELNAIKSRERLQEAKALVDVAKKKVSPKTKEGRLVSDLEEKIKIALPKATKEYEVTPELFFDVSLLKNGGVISSFGLFEDTMAFLDAKSKTVFVLQLSTKNGQIVAGGSNLDGSQTVAIHGDTVYVGTPEGIHVINVQDKTVKQYVIKKAADWIAIKALVSFGGNLYLLDTGKGRIWKYVATGSAFSDLREYLNPDYFPDLSKTTNIAIDGSVWLGTTNGSIMRFTQGKEDLFITKGVDPAFGTTTMVFTDDNSTYVYVLDPDHKRVVVLEKDGMYKSQYLYPSSFTPTAIAASEKLGKIFLFSDGKLYTVSLQ